MKVCVAAVALTLVVLSVCRADAEGGRPVRVSVSIPPLAEIVRRIGGDVVVVNVMLPPGASPHTYEIKPRDMIRYQESAAFVMVGSGLDFWVEKIAGSDGRKPIVRITDGMKLLGADAHAGHGQGGDPHVWLDPTLMAQAADRIAGMLSRLAPGEATAFRSRLAALKKDLLALDTEIRERLSSVRNRKMITFHNAWAYFARRYGLMVEEVIIDVPGKEPSPRKIKKIVDALGKQRIPALFVEPQMNPAAARSIAEDSGVPVVLIDPNGGVPGREDYFELLRFNASRIAEALR